jgi:prolyl-tRNA editing enzyme YbaK/EbsC (Cys-tRNA(Pro) deacylase)
VKAAVARVIEALRAAGVDAAVTEFATSTRTAEEAAAAVGASVGQIVKSLVFLAGDRPVLALVSGANRVDTEKLARVAGDPIRRADADTVRAATGFAIGGVPPVGHAGALATFLDADLLRYDVVWAAAGTPYTVFPLPPATLERISGAQVVDLAAVASAPPGERENGA